MDGSSYDILNLDPEAVKLAIEKCLPLLSDSELQSLSNCFSYTIGDVKPPFLVFNSEKKYLDDIIMEAPNKRLIIHTFDPSKSAYAAESKKVVNNSFTELRDIIERIKVYIDKWDEILETPAPELDTTPQNTTEESSVDSSNFAQKISIDEDMIGVSPDGTPVNIPKGEYEILDTQVINGETYVKIEINGEYYWVKYENGLIFAYIDPTTEETKPNTEEVTITELGNDNYIYIAGALFALVAGSYQIVTYFEENGDKYAVVLINGKYYKVAVDNDGNIIPGSTAEVVGGTYAVVDEEITIEVDGQTITIKKGRYQIIIIKEVDGKKYGLICIDGKYYWVLLDENNNIVPKEPAKIEHHTSIIVPEPTPIETGDEPVEIPPGEYEIIEIREIDGKKYGLICVDGEYYWIPLDDDNNIDTGEEAITVESTEVTISEGLTVIVEGESITVTAGEYTIIDIREIDGKKYGLVLIDGEYYWVPIDNQGNIIPGGEAIRVNNSEYSLQETLTFVVNGETIIVNPGDYPIAKIMATPDGGHAYCLFVEGRYVWVYYDKDGNFLYSLVELEQEGIYSFTDHLQIIDNLGNVVGKTDQYTYHIYAIRYDEQGRIVAIRISPPGYPEKWIIVRKDGVDYGTYTALDDTHNDPNKAVQYSYFKDHKKLLGCLLGLAAVLGAAIVYKKKKGSEEVEETYEIEDGEYPVFEENMDEDGNVESVRISNDDSDDEYWMEVR